MYDFYRCITMHTCIDIIYLTPENERDVFNIMMLHGFFNGWIRKK